MQRLSRNQLSDQVHLGNSRSAHSFSCFRDLPISLPRYPRTLPPPPLPPKSLRDICAASAGIGEIINAKNVLYLFAVWIVGVFTMKRDVNDASSEDIHLRILVSILAVGLVSVCQTCSCDAQPNLSLGSRHSFFPRLVITSVTLDSPAMVDDECYFTHGIKLPSR